TPDLVFRPRRKVIFVHGCYWHLHEGCPLARFPKSPETRDFWRAKLEGNRVRDQESERRLREAGWRVLVVWECELGDMDALRERIASFLQ
ncbi:very short patch repair endonuclease, partial [Enterococcus hirae]